MTARLRLVDHNRVEKSLATDGFDERGFKGMQPITEYLPQRLRAVRQLLVAHDLEGTNRDRAAERVPAVRTAVSARLDRQHDILAAKHARDGVHAAGDGLAQEHHIGLDAGPFVAEQLAGAGDARLDLVADEEDVVFCAEFAELGEVSVVGYDDAGFALDGLDEEGGDLGPVGLEGCADGGDVVEGDGFAGYGAGGADVGEVGAVVVAGFGVRGHGDGCELWEVVLVGS